MSTIGAGISQSCPNILRAKSLTEKLNIASIAVVGRGWSYANGASKGHNFVAFCDVMTEVSKRKGGYVKAAKYWPKARRYQDWRRILDESQYIDAITISTPDHMHALPTLAVLTLGKHVFRQKPLTHTVHESRTRMAEARRLGVATQMGIQNQSTVVHRMTAAMVQAGLIGKIKEAHGWSHKGWAGPNEGRPSRSDRIPNGLDWNLWLGVATARPYKETFYQPMNWRGWLDLGAGTLGDMGIHIFESMVSSLGVDPPISIQSMGEAPYPETWQPTNTIQDEFAGNEFTADKILPYFWRDDTAGKPPRSICKHLPANLKLSNQATLFVGKRSNRPPPRW